MNTPYQWTKQVASHWGGTRTGTIVRWPRGIDARGEVRHQFHHVIDVAPTVLEAAGLPEPTFVHGVQQRPYEGVSMAYTFDDEAAAERRRTQYFEMFVNRGIYHQGWTAVTRHSTPWDQRQAAARRSTTTSGSSTGPTTGPRPTTSQPSNPEKLRAAAAQVPPRGVEVQGLPARRPARSNGSTPTSPDGRTLIKGNSQVLFGGHGPADRERRAQREEQVPRGHRRPHRARRRREPASSSPRAAPSAAGASTCHGRASRPTATTSSASNASTCTATTGVPAGDHQVRLEFTYDGGGLGKGGTADLYVDGTKVGERPDRRAPCR